MSKNKRLVDFGARLKTLRNNKGMSQEELAFESQLDRTYISMLERNVKNPTTTTIFKIAKALMINPAQFFEPELPTLSKEDTKKDKIRFPFYGTAVSCGMPVAENYHADKILSLDDFLIKSPKKTFFVKASGDSMNPIIQNGDLLIIEQTTKTKNGDIILAQINHEFTVKRFQKTDGVIHLIPENPQFKEIILSDFDEVIICGVVVAINRSL